MTFSTKSVCDATRKSFTPVWESVSPTTVATFDLGDGESVKGTIGGEIMLYFCRPDGVVFDALPALQSPQIVLQAIERAAKFYKDSQGAPESAIRTYHDSRLNQIAFEQGISPTEAKRRVEAAHTTLKQRLAMGDSANDALTTGLLSKVLVITPAEDITVVEPGGLWLYSLQVCDVLQHGPLQTPMGWKYVMFEVILDQALGGGEKTYDATSLVPMSLLPSSDNSDPFK